CKLDPDHATPVMGIGEKQELLYQIIAFYPDIVRQPRQKPYPLSFAERSRGVVHRLAIPDQSVKSSKCLFILDWHVPRTDNTEYLVRISAHRSEVALDREIKLLCLERNFFYFKSQACSLNRFLSCSRVVKFSPQLMPWYFTDIHHGNLTVRFIQIVSH